MEERMNHTRRWLVLVFLIIALAVWGWVYLAQYAKRLQTVPRELTAEQKTQILQSLPAKVTTTLTAAQKEQIMSSFKK